MSNAERLARIDAVTVADVRSVLTHYIYDKVCGGGGGVLYDKVCGGGVGCYLP